MPEVIKIPLSQAKTLYPHLSLCEFFYDAICDIYNLDPNEVLLLGGSVRNAMRATIRPNMKILSNEYDFFVHEKYREEMKFNPDKIKNSKITKMRTKSFVMTVSGMNDFDIVPVKEEKLTFKSIVERFDFTVNACGIQNGYLYYTCDCMKDLIDNKITLINEENFKYITDARLCKFEEAYGFKVDDNTKNIIRAYNASQTHEGEYAHF